MTIFVNYSAPTITQDELLAVHTAISARTVGYFRLYVATESHLENTLPDTQINIGPIPKINLAPRPHNLTDVVDIPLNHTPPPLTQTEWDGIDAMLRTLYLQWQNGVRMCADVSEGVVYTSCATIGGIGDIDVIGDHTFLEENFIHTTTSTGVRDKFFDHMLPQYRAYRSDLATQFKLSHLWKYFGFLDFEKYIWPDFSNRTQSETPETIAAYIPHVPNFVFKHWCTTHQVKVRFL